MDWSFLSQVGNDITGMRGSFGRSVAFSSDGTRLAVGAPQYDPGNDYYAGLVQVFDWTGSSWSQVGNNLTGCDGYYDFGHSLAFSSDGTRLAVGSPGYGSYLGLVQVFEWTDSSSPWSVGCSWSQIGNSLTGQVFEGSFGTTVAFSSDGTRLAVGAPQNYREQTLGIVQIFDWTDSSWSQVGNNVTGTEVGE